MFEPAGAARSDGRAARDVSRRLADGIDSHSHARIASDAVARRVTGVLAAVVEASLSDEVPLL